ncbi:FAD-dependent monooxygenase [Falsiroseomonas sp. HW251]|uniref:FAD-dependent monooxygenase n=1 Tax=Falsiroseomonas sp. HW251 TaxID=3390998 RepID=UPI003D311AE5
MQTEVLIAGGGPIGLALAVELGLRGIRTTLVEQHERKALQPRAKTTNVRSMEHMRRWGIAKTLRASAPLPPDFPTDVTFQTRLFGHHLTTFHNAFYGARDARDDRFSEGAQWIPQYKVEAVLKAHAAAQPSVTLRSGVRLDAVTQSPDGIEATVVDAASGQASAIRAQYLVGADGSRSQVREMIGARMEGDYAFAQHIGYVLRSPALSEIFATRRAIMYWLANADCPATCGPMDVDDTWFFGFPIPNGTEPPEGAELRQRINAAFGREVPFEIIVDDRWSAHSLIANRYAQGRIFLAGDACHIHPPYGGYGMNLGLGDSVDLGWKLAAVLRGWGGPRLLDSYEAERRPVHRRVVAEAVANHSLLSGAFARPELEQDGPAADAVRREVGELIQSQKIREFRTLGVVIGYHYDGSPILVPDGTPAPPERVTEYEPSARPGCVAPHLWLRDGDSLYDRFGQYFTLLVTDTGASDEAGRLATAASRSGVPLSVVTPRDDRLRDLYGARLALIRPDQHVAWRGDTAGDAAAILDTIRGA